MVLESKLVYHFTKSFHALENIEKQRVKLSIFDGVNDKRELTAYDFNFPPGIPDKFLTDAFKARSYLLCFGPNSTNQILWERYGDGHKGICLGLSMRTRDLRPIVYVKERTVQPYPERLVKAASKGQQSSRAFNRLSHAFEPVLTTKFATFVDSSGEVLQSSSEEEIRAIFQKGDGSKYQEENGRSFANFNETMRLKEVILGKACDVSVSSVSALVKSYSRGVVTVTRACHEWRT